VFPRGGQLLFGAGDLTGGLGLFGPGAFQLLRQVVQFQPGHRLRQFGVAVGTAFSKLRGPRRVDARGFPGGVGPLDPVVARSVGDLVRFLARRRSRPACLSVVDGLGRRPLGWMCLSAGEVVVDRDVVGAAGAVTGLFGQRDHCGVGPLGSLAGRVTRLATVGRVEVGRVEVGPAGGEDQDLFAVSGGRDVQGRGVHAGGVDQDHPPPEAPSGRVQPEPTVRPSALCTVIA
jgi:hypothetical protein